MLPMSSKPTLSRLNDGKTRETVLRSISTFFSGVLAKDSASINPRLASGSSQRNILPSLANELARAVLTGSRYPRTLLTAILMRIRADGVINDIRAAICKACIVRDQRMNQRKENVPVSLDVNEANPGYRLGRLFAILERAQYEAIGKEINATIRDKYFSSASANPARVFPLLLRGVQDHLGKIRSKGSGGLAFWFDGQITEIMGGLPSSQPFPNILRLEDQGRFAVGYYHQRNTRKNKEELLDEDVQS